LESSAWLRRGYTHRVRLQPSVSLIVAADYLDDTRRLSFRCNVACVARQKIESERVVSASKDNTARMWDAASGKSIGELR